MRNAGLAEREQFEAWQLIDDGMRLGDEEKIWQGNLALLDFEQRVTAQRHYSAPR